MLKLLIYLLLILFPVLDRAGYSETICSQDLTDLYSALNLSDKGLSHEVFQLALKGHDKLDRDGKLRNREILTIVDFSQSSKNKRLYVIDLQKKTLVFNTLVAHGRNTGEEFAKYFSNRSGSYQSSLGFYITREKITGSKVGPALSLEGVEKGINDNALSREIIMHGADYATEDFICRTGRLGRSFGCPALPPDMIRPVVDAIKEGSCLFIYYPDKSYLDHSALLKPNENS